MDKTQQGFSPKRRKKKEKKYRSDIEKKLNESKFVIIDL